MYQFAKKRTGVCRTKVAIAYAGEKKGANILSILIIFGYLFFLFPRPKNSLGNKKKRIQPRTTPLENAAENAKKYQMLQNGFC